MTLTFEQLKKRKQPQRATVRIVMDSELGHQIQALRGETAILEIQAGAAPGFQTKLKEKLDALAKLEKRAETESVEFVFQAVSRETYDEIVSAHPATPKQKKEAQDRGEPKPAINPDLFGPAIVAASLVEPKLTEKQVNELWNDPNWNQAELLALQNVAIDVNQSRVIIDS